MSSRFALFIVCACTAAVVATSASAQTAYFAGATTTLDNGFTPPEGVAVDSHGNVFVADTFRGLVREILAVNGSIPSSPSILTVGSGFSYPKGLAVDASGNVFVADYGNGAVKEIVAVGGLVSSNSTVNVVGSGFANPYGVAVDGGGNVYVADLGNSAVYEIVATGGLVSSGSTVNILGSGFNQPYGVAVDVAGDVYVADTGNTLVKEIVAVGGVIPATPTINVLGSGFTGPSGIAVDASGNVYVSDQGNNVVQKLVAVNGSIPASPTMLALGQGFSFPTGVAVDAKGNIYVADTYNHAAKEIQPGGVNLGSLAVGTQSGTVSLTFRFSSGGSVGSPAVLTQAAPSLDFTDALSGTCTSNGSSQTYAAGDTCTVDVLYTAKFAGTRNGAVVLSDSNGAPIATAYVYGLGVGPQIAFGPSPQTTLFDAVSSGLNQPFSVAIDGSGNLYLADTGNARVLKETPSGGGSYTQTTIGSGWVSPYSVAVDAAGNLYVTDTTLDGVIKETPDGTGGYVQSTAVDGHNGATALFNPTSTVVDESGNLYVVDFRNGRVVKETLVAGSYTQTVVVAGLHLPWGVAVDAAGDVFITDSYNSRVLKETPTAAGYTQSLIGTNWNLPEGIAVDASGNVYVTDYRNNGLMEVTPSGTQMSLGGGWNNIRDVVLDSSGNIYIADGGNNRVEELNVALAPTLTFATSTIEGTTDSADGVQTVTITNIGNAPLSFAIPGTGSNPSISNDFLLSTGGTACPSLTSSSSTVFSVAAAASCTLGVEFAPVAPDTGSLSGSIVLTDNNLNAMLTPATQQSIALYGTAAAVPVDATSTSIQVNPAAVAMGSPITIVTSVTDTSNIAVVPGGSVTLTDTLGATVTPLNAGNPVPLVSGVATLANITLLGSGQHTISATYAGGSGLAASSNTGVATVTAVTPTPRSPTGTATSAIPVTVTFTTSGTLGTIQVLTQGKPNLDFSDAASGDTCSLSTSYNAGATCVVNVIFTPRNAGARYGAVVLTDTSGNLLANAYVEGVGTSPQLSYANTTLGSNYPVSATTLGGGFAFSGPSGVAVDAAGDVYVGDSGNHAVEEIPAGCSLASCVLTLGGGFAFNYPMGVAVDGAGNVFVADNGNRAVYELLATGGYTTVLSLGDSNSNGNPKGIALDGSANVYIAGSNNAVYVIPAAGGYATSTELGGNFLNPGGVAVDAAGNIFVADTNNGPIKEMPAGCYTASCVTTLADFGYPSGVAVDAADNLYVATGGITQVLSVGGTSANSYATFIGLTSPGVQNNASAIAVASNGNIFFTNGNDVEEFDYADPPSFTFATSTAAGQLDSTDGTQTITVSNIGNAALTFSSIAYPADFSAPSGSTGNCSNSAPLSVGTTCPLPVNFTPTQAGNPLSESLVLSGRPLSGTDTSQSFTLIGTAFPTPAANTLIASTELTANQPSTTFKPVAGSSGVAPLVYSVSPALPTGLVLSTTTGSISGLPSSADASTTYTVIVTDANSSTATATFLLKIDSSVVATQAIASTSLTVNHAASSFTPVSGSGGAATLTYSVSPALPSGLIFSATGAVSGTPTAASPANSYIVTVTDSNGATNTSTFSLTVNAAVNAVTATSSTVLTAGHAATAFNPVTASGGTGTLTYSVTPALPAGLAFSATGAVSGTPTAVSAATSYTVTVTDANSSTATANFSLTVNAAVNAVTATSSTVLTAGHAATAFNPVTASGGTGTLTYSVSPALPAGLAFSATGAVSGTPTAVSAATSYTVTVTDNNGATITSTFSLTVNVAVTAVTATSSTMLTAGHAAAGFTPVTASGGTGTLTYSVSPVLPAGLAFSATGAVSGTPTAVSAATSYTVTVTDSNGAFGAATFTLTIDSAVIATQAIASTSLTVYQSATTFTPVTASGGSGPLTYSVSPPLPTGLVLSSSTGAINGSPTAAYANTSYTITATDANSTVATAEFSLAVNKQSTTTVATVDQASITPTQSVTLTATVAVTIGGTPVLPTGSVTFFDGTSQIGSPVNIVNGKATLLLSSLSAGATSSLSATYSGDGDFQPSASNSTIVAVAPLDFTLTTSGAATYLGIPVTMATYPFAVSPLYGNYAGPVSFTVTGLPAGATAEFTPSSVTSGSGATQVVMTVHFAPIIAQIHRADSRPGDAIVWALLLLPFVGTCRMREKTKRGSLFVLLLIAGLTATLTGCGSYVSALQNPQSYTLTVTATSGSISQHQNVVLTIR